jgi:hypothetical protein
VRGTTGDLSVRGIAGRERMGMGGCSTWTDAVHGCSTWTRYMDVVHGRSIYGRGTWTHWMQYMDAVHGCGAWMQCMAALHGRRIYGCGTWTHIYGCSAWMRCMDAVHGRIGRKARPSRARPSFPTLRPPSTSTPVGMDCIGLSGTAGAHPKGYSSIQYYPQVPPLRSRPPAAGGRPQGRAQSRSRCGGVSPVPEQMRHLRMKVVDIGGEV